MSRHLLEQKKEGHTLTPACAALVVLSEPEDAYLAYESSMAVAFISQNIQPLEKKWGLKVLDPSYPVALLVLLANPLKCMSLAWMPFPCFCIPSARPCITPICEFVWVSFFFHSSVCATCMEGRMGNTSASVDKLSASHFAFSIFTLTTLKAESWFCSIQRKDPGAQLWRGYKVCHVAF